MATNLVLSDVINPATQPQWLSTLLSALGTLGITTTTWQSGGVARTIVALMSYTLASEDSLVSMAAQGGFLDFAASGTVPFTTTSGTTTTVPVTPDPSTLTVAQLSSWVPGWLDILADGSYNCQRIAASYASGTMALTNTTATSYGTYAPGTFHVANPTTGASYSNVASFTLAAANIVGTVITNVSNGTPASVTTSTAHGLSSGQTVTIANVLGLTGVNGSWAITVTGTTTFSLNGSVPSGAYISGGTVNVATVAAFQADTIGPSSSSSAGTITSTVTSLIGVSCSNPSTFTGTNYESNTALAARCRLKLQSLSPNGAAGAYAFFALTALQLLQAISPTYLLVGGVITRATVSAGAGVVITYIANAQGAPAGGTAIAVTGAVNNGSGLIRLTLGTPTTIATGTLVVVSTVGGVSNANGIWTATFIDTTHIDLQGSAFAGVFTSGGNVGYGDVALVDYILQTNCVPLGITGVTTAATPSNVNVAATVYVPIAQLTSYTAAVQSAIANYFSTLPIGGLNTDGASNVVPLGGVEGVLYQAGSVSGAQSYVRGITGLTLNGVAADVAIGGVNVVAQLNTQTITVIGQ